MLERGIRFIPGYDKRNDPKGNYGVHNMEMFMYVRGSRGAIQLTIGTGWYPASVDHFTNKPSEHPRGYGFDYHSRYPVFADEEMGDSRSMSVSNKCHLIDGTCYYGGSGAQVDVLCGEFKVHGSNQSDPDDLIWRVLEGEYHLRFGDCADGYPAVVWHGRTGEDKMSAEDRLAAPLTDIRNEMYYSIPVMLPSRKAEIGIPHGPRRFVEGIASAYDQLQWRDDEGEGL